MASSLAQQQTKAQKDPDEVAARVRALQEEVAGVGAGMSSSMRLNELLTLANSFAANEFVPLEIEPTKASGSGLQSNGKRSTLKKGNASKKKKQDKKGPA